MWFFVSCLVAGFVKCPDQSQPKTRKDEKIFPDGQDSVNVAGLGAEEHLAAIHADLLAAYHRLAIAAGMEAERARSDALVAELTAVEVELRQRAANISLRQV